MTDLNPHSTHCDHLALPSSSPRPEVLSGPSSEPSSLTWPSAADRLSPPLVEPCWLLSQPPNRWTEHFNISQKHLNNKPSLYNADLYPDLRSLLIDPVQPGLCLLHCHVPVLQRTCEWEPKSRIMLYFVKSFFIFMLTLSFTPVLTFYPLEREQDFTHMLRVVRGALNCSVESFPTVNGVSARPAGKVKCRWQHEQVSAECC